MLIELISRRYIEEVHEWKILHNACGFKTRVYIYIVIIPKSQAFGQIFFKPLDRWEVIFPSISIRSSFKDFSVNLKGMRCSQLRIRWTAITGFTMSNLYRKSDIELCNKSKRGSRTKGPDWFWFLKSRSLNYIMPSSCMRYLGKVRRRDPKWLLFFFFSRA